MFKRKSVLLLLCLLLISVLSACGPDEPQAGDPPTEHSIDCDTVNLISILENAGPNGVIINLSQCVYTLEEVNNYPDKVDGDDFGPVGLPAINVPVTINGFGQATIQRSSADSIPAFRLFYVGESGSLTLNDLILLNGDLDPYRSEIDYGGAILIVGGQVEINNCLFENHSAYNGGAIHNRDGTVLINTSNFESNQAGYGGALYNESASTLEINASSFLTNTSEIAGGAMVNFGDLTIATHDSLFRANEAGGYGGAIYNFDGTGEVSFTSFENNTSTSGGAVASFGPSANLIFNNDDFKQNVIEGISAYGGAAYLGGGGYTQFSGCYFNGNSAQMGGAIFLEEGSLSIGSGSSILNNHAAAGGGIMMENFTTGRIAASRITDNTAENYGGGIVNYGTLDILLSTISSNEALTLDSGGIYNHGGVDIFQSTLYENVSPRSGGAIYNTGHTIVINSTISNNHAESGSAFYSGGEVTLVNTTIADNNAEQGAALFQIGGDLTIKNTIVANNKMGGEYINNCQIQAFAYTTLGENLSDDEFCPDFTIQADAHLQPLTDNGGYTLTHEIGWISPARDAATECTDHEDNPLDEDQRGITRPQNGVCDIGAYEIEDMAAPIVPPIPTILFLNNSSCRERPGSEFQSLAFFSTGDSAEVTGINPNQTWFQVVIPDSEAKCWVWENLVQFEGELESLRVVAPDVADEKTESCQPPEGGCPEKDIPICWDAEECECVACD